MSRETHSTYCRKSSFAASFQFHLALLFLLAASLGMITGCGGLKYNNSGTGSTQSNAIALSAITCGTQSLTGPQSKTCSLSLSAAALTATTVKLSSSNAALQVPSEVKIAVGQSSADFKAVTPGVNKTVTASITANLQGVTKSAALTLYPAGAATLASISCTTQTLTGPATDGCSVHLGAAAANPVSITLSSSSSTIQVPQTVTVNAGSDAAQFTATASAVASTQNVTLTASVGSVAQTFAISVVGSSSQSSVQHKVQLSWSAPASSPQPIVGYNVYRAESNISTYTLLSSLDPQTSYVDAGVLSGYTYDYVVKSVDSTGLESSPSNSTRVTIP